MTKNKQGHDFEKKLKELETIVQKLEEGSLTLQDSLEAFEKGVKLVRQCRDTLDTAEQKLECLTESAPITDPEQNKGNE